MQKKIINNQRAFTLVETLFAVAIFVAIVGVITLFSRNVWIYNTFVSAGLVNADAGRQVLKTMVSEIRTASTSDLGTYAIPASGATASSFIFYSNIDGDASKEKIRYFLSGTTLQKGVTKGAGSEKISTLASNVTSVVFNYYDKNYDGTTAPLGAPVDISAIRLVKITITMDQDPNRPPAPLTLSTQVSMRNLKDNL